MEFRKLLHRVGSQQLSASIQIANLWNCESGTVFDGLFIATEIGLGRPFEVGAERRGDDYGRRSALLAVLDEQPLRSENDVSVRSWLAAARNSAPIMLRSVLDAALNAAPPLSPRTLLSAAAL